MSKSNNTCSPEEDFISYYITSKLVSVYRDIDKESSGKYLILWYLYYHQEGVYVKDITAFMHTSTPHTAMMLNHLEEKGLIIRNRSASDSRKIVVHLTDKGNEQVVKEHHTIKMKLNELFQYLGESDTSEFLRIQKRVLDFAGLKPFVKQEEENI